MLEQAKTIVNSSSEVSALSRQAIVFAAILGGMSVIIGAFAAHALKNAMSPYALGIVETATKYQMYHALALFGVGLSVGLPCVNIKYLKYSIFALVAGILLFSGSLYLLAITQLKWLGVITPLGGIGMIAGWCFIACAFLCADKLRSNDEIQPDE